MHSSHKLVGLLASIALVATSPAAKKPENPRAPAKESGKKKSSSKNEKKGEAVDGEGKMSLPIPKGHDSKGLKIPYFTENGKQLQMTFTIGIASRLDDDHVRMSELQIETFDAKGERDMLIALPNSVLDLNTRVVTTKEGATIKRSDFEISGESMEFNTRTKAGQLAGRVHMIIYNLQEETKPSAGGSAGE